jgi:hypothetical protein
MNQIEAMKRALSFLRSGNFVYPAELAERLEKAIEQAEKQEPVAYLHEVVGGDSDPDQALSFSKDSFPLQGVGGFESVGCRPLVFGDSAAQPAKPLTKKQRSAVLVRALKAMESNPNLSWLKAIVDEVEAAHDIKGAA